MSGYKGTFSLRYRMIESFQIIVLFFTLLGLCGIYLKSVYHIDTVNDAKKIFEVISKPKHNKRCRVVNSTHYQCLPNVFLIGASKAGTTSIIQYLSKHPRVAFVKRRYLPTRHKEIHRLDRNTYGWSIPYIELLDEWSNCPEVKDTNMIIIHYTPHYLYAPTVPFELNSLYPDIQSIKFIIILREPVARTISSYWFKNSRLLQKKDKGSVVHFQREARHEMADRKIFEKCMSRKLSQSYNSLAYRRYNYSINNNYHIFHHYHNFYSSNNNSINNSNMTSIKSNVTVTSKKLYKSLQYCFGSTMLRSPTLGIRHVDKSIYWDQILRWKISFQDNNQQFYITTLEAWMENPIAAITNLSTFLGWWN